MSQYSILKIISVKRTYQHRLKPNNQKTKHGQELRELSCQFYKLSNGEISH